ncbi:hypothetical protein N9Y42_08255 [Mariniblastus sp.]|nr:hypothetical protein [Mariniblastus sp.]
MPENPYSNESPSSLQPSPFNSSLKWKMFTLIGMLVMVIYSMNEAGKPENWAWMGFEKGSNSSETKKTNDLPATSTRDTTSDATNSLPNTTRGNETASPQPLNPTTSVEPTSSGDTTKTDATQSDAIQPDAIQLTELSPSFKQSNQPTDLPTESAKFWSSFFKSLTTAEKVEWMELLEALQSDQSPTERTPASQIQKKLIAQAEKKRDVFNNKLLDRMDLISRTSEKRAQASKQYFDANKFWKKQISPALTAALDSQDLTLTQRQAVIDLQHHLDGDALNLVQDRTAIGWVGDSVAWKRCWNKIHRGEINDPTFVKRIQLIGQPQEYRGKSVTVYGFVRDIETRTESSDSSIARPQPNNATEVTYYILWVQPSNSDAGPYCVYCLDLPADLPRSRQELIGFQQMATINGIFFKNRSYQAADRTVQYCPVLLTDGLKLKPPPLKLSRAWMSAALMLVPILGVGIVWYAVRSTVSRKRLPSKKSQEETNVFLGDLKNDPSIKTDLEQIEAIAEHEGDIL